MDLATLTERMKSYVEAFSSELAKIRGGSASAAMLDHLLVDAYGSKQPLPSVAQAALQGPVLVVRPFDPSVSVRGRQRGWVLTVGMARRRLLGSKRPSRKQTWD
jgi:ribosome recycling factor